MVSYVISELPVRMTPSKAQNDRTDLLCHHSKYPLTKIALAKPNFKSLAPQKHNSPENSKPSRRNTTKPEPPTLATWKDHQKNRTLQENLARPLRAPKNHHSKTQNPNCTKPAKRSKPPLHHTKRQTTPLLEPLEPRGFF